MPVWLLLFENRVCCENSGMTARLSVARSVPVLTAVVTVVSDSPAPSTFHLPSSIFYLPSSIFQSVLQSTSAILELIPSTFNLGCLFRSSTVAFGGTEEAVRDLVGLQSTAELCQPLARRCSWGFRRRSPSVLWLVNYINYFVFLPNIFLS